MALTSGFGAHNRLVRRVMRHRAIATLFRPAVGTRSARAGSTSSGAPTIVRALMVEEPDVSPEDAIESPVARPVLPQRETAVPSSQPPTSADQRAAPVAGQVTPAEESDAESSLTDEVWRRLTTIFRRHQEDAEEPATPETAAPEDQPDSEVPQAVQPPASPPTSQPRAPSGDRGPQPEAGAPPPTAAETGPTEHVEEEPPDAVDVRPRLPAQEEGPTSATDAEGSPTDATAPTPTDRAVQRARIEPVTAVPPTPSGREEGPVSPPRAQDSAAEPSGTSTPRRLARAGRPDEPSIVTPSAPQDLGADQERTRVELPGRIAAPPEADAITGGQEDARAGERVASEPESDRPPLEAVWQVERVPGPRITPPERLSEKAEPTARPEERRSPSATATSVAQVLDRVAAGRPTQSSIETLPPRRPRPPTRSPAQRTEVEEPGIAKTMRPLGEPETEVEPAAVRTEIGPLPADLWDLIEEPVPEGHPAARRPDTSRESAGRREPATLEQLPATASLQAETVGKAEPIAPRPSPRPTPDTGAVVQRVAAPGLGVWASQAEATARGSTDHALSSDEAEDVDVLSGLDLEELARRVYADLKRRLAIEAERLRRR